MTLLKQKNRGINLLIKLTLLAFVCYVTCTLVSLQVQINHKRAELENINQEIVVQEMKNEEINKVLQSNEQESREYIEKIARESLDFAKDGERVFVNVSGN